MLNHLTTQGVLLAAIPRQRLEQMFHLPLDTAAEELGLGLTAMKSLCRHHNLSRWPFRKMQCLKRFQPVLQVRDGWLGWVFGCFVLQHLGTHAFYIIFALY